MPFSKKKKPVVKYLYLKDTVKDRDYIEINNEIITPTSTNIYPIKDTINLHDEQKSGAYLDPNFWPNFQETLEDFKSLLIKNVKLKIPFSVLRLGHSERDVFEVALKINKNPNKLLLRQSKSGKIPNDTLIKLFESIIKSDYISTQIGYDFKQWINEIMKFVDYYTMFKLKPDVLTNTEKFIDHSFPDKNIKDLIDLPLDIIYGLIANKWVFKTFKNKIGLIGAKEKLDLIKELIKYKEYQEYIGTDYFTDYIEIPQKAALDSDQLEADIIKGIKESSCDIFLIGAGVSKLKFYHLLKTIKNCVYIDVGHGICMIAGWGDNTRPYCGTWVNYRIKDLETNIDSLGTGNTEIKYLSKKKIALQFVGLIRGFKFDNVRINIYNRIIKELEDQGFIVDIFCHTYDIEYDDIILKLDKNKFKIKGIKLDSDQEIQNYLENDYKLMEKYNFYPHWTNAHKFGWFKYQYSIKQVTILRNKYERENNIKYDWVINTSPQMEPQLNIDNLTVLDNNFLYSPNYAKFEGYYGSFFFGNPTHLNYIGNLYDYMIEKRFKTDSNKNFEYFKKELINAEPIFKQFIDCKYKMRDILNIKFYRVRFNGMKVDY